MTPYPECRIDHGRRHGSGRHRQRHPALCLPQTATTFTSTYHRFNSATAHGAVTSHTPLSLAPITPNTHIGNVTLSGTINNTGTLSVTATAAGSNATANGIAVDGGTLTGASILNAGTINATGSGATATVNDELLTGSGAVTVSDKGGKLNATATSTTGAAVAIGVNLTDATLAGSSFTGGGGTIAANGANGATANGWLISGAGKITFAGSGGTLNVSANATKGTATANGINIQGGALTGSTISNGDSVSVSATGIAGTTPVANALLVVGTGAFAVNNVGGTLSSLVTVAGVGVLRHRDQCQRRLGGHYRASGRHHRGQYRGSLRRQRDHRQRRQHLVQWRDQSVQGLAWLADRRQHRHPDAGHQWRAWRRQYLDRHLHPAGHPGAERHQRHHGGGLDPCHHGHPVRPDCAEPQCHHRRRLRALSTTYKVVFTTGALTGTWSSVTVTDPTFFTAAGVYSRQ